MDLDDLFGAFDGAEKINDVNEATDELSAGAGKRKVVTDEGHGEGPENKRQASKGNEGTESGGVADKLDSSSAATTRVDGRVALKEGEESSTLREDGTFVKSVRTTSFCPALVAVVIRATACLIPLFTRIIINNNSMYPCTVLVHTNTAVGYSTQMKTYLILSVHQRAQLLLQCHLTGLYLLLSRNIIRALRLPRARTSRVGYNSVEGFALPRLRVDATCGPGLSNGDYRTM